jgi:hypothetical protein
LVKALLTGLAMQRRLDPDSVDDRLAVRGMAALLGLPPETDQTAGGDHEIVPQSTASTNSPAPPPSNTTTEETKHEH